MVLALKLERVRSGFSQTDLFVKTGIPQWRISLIERGIPAKAEEKAKIAEVLGKDEKDLFQQI